MVDYTQSSNPDSLVGKLGGGIKKNILNNAESPTELYAELNEGDEQFITSGTVQAGLGMKLKDSEGSVTNSVHRKVVKNSNGRSILYEEIGTFDNGEETIDVKTALSETGYYLAYGNDTGQRILPTIIILSNTEHDYFSSLDIDGQPRTFTHPGLYALLNSIYPHKFKIRIVGESDIFDAEVLFIYQSSSSRAYILMYGKGKHIVSARVYNDDTIKVHPVYIYPKRFLAKTYGFTVWYNAAGNSVSLYNDLMTSIAGNSNSEGALIYLCDSNNVFNVLNLNLDETGTLPKLTVTFLEGNVRYLNILTITSDGNFSTKRYKVNTTEI